MDTGVRERAFVGRQWWSRSLPGHGVRRVRELNLATHVLALSAQQVLCTAPLVVALSAVLQRVTGRGVGAVLSRFFGLHGAAAADMTALFKGSETVSTTVLLIGLLVAVGFAASVAATLQRGFELMWGLPHAGGLRSLARQLGWAVSLPGYVVGVIFAGRAGRTVGHMVSLGLPTEILLQVLLTLLFHWWGQHVLLSGRVCWRDLVPGALTVALATLVLVKLSNLVLPSQIDEQVADYGLIGAVFVLSIWLMVLSAVLLGGTLFGAVLIQRRAQATQARAPVPGAEARAPVPGAEAAGPTGTHPTANTVP